MNCTPVGLWSLIGQFHRATPLVDMYHRVKVKDYLRINSTHMQSEPILSPTGGNKLNILYIWPHPDAPEWPA